jgi:hypothetical protein
MELFLQEEDEVADRAAPEKHPAQIVHDLRSDFRGFRIHLSPITSPEEPTRRDLVKPASAARRAVQVFATASSRLIPAEVGLGTSSELAP